MYANFRKFQSFKNEIIREYKNLQQKLNKRKTVKITRSKNKESEKKRKTQELKNTTTTT